MGSRFVAGRLNYRLAAQPLPSPGGKVARPERSKGIAGRKGNAGGNLHIKDTFQACYKAEHRIRPIPFQNHNVIARIPLPPFGHRSRGMISPGDHFYYDPLRDAPPPGEGSGCAAKR